MHTPIVSIINGEPLASSEVIAKGVGLQHKNVLALARNHAATLMEFGKLAFETRVNRRGQHTEIAMLNERQASLLLTMMRNTKAALAFKVNLVREFYRMRDTLDQRDQNLWQQMHALIAQEVESKVRASFGSHLMLERKKEIPGFCEQFARLEAEIQPGLPLH